MDPTGAPSSPRDPRHRSRATAPVATVLLIDDDAAVRAAVQAVLVGRGVRVFLATQGTEALDVFQQRRAEIDIVILDLQMPRMDGGQVLRELRVIQPDVKVVISTGGP